MAKQLNLFPSDKQAYQLVRGLDPGTSYEAAEKILPKLRKLQSIVYEHFLSVGSVGLTDYELEERCHDHSSTYRTRRAELVDLGVLKDSGGRRFLKGRNRIVWVLAKL